MHVKKQLIALLLAVACLFGGTSYALNILPSDGPHLAMPAGDKTIVLNGAYTTLDLTALDLTGVTISCTGTTTVDELKTPAALKNVTINGGGLLTVKKWDLGGAPSWENVAVYNVLFDGSGNAVGAGGGSDYFIFTNPQWAGSGQPRITLKGSILFNGCAFTCGEAFEWIGVDGDGSLTVSSCTFKGINTNGVNEMFNVNSQGALTITGGSVENGYILLSNGGGNNGTRTVSGVNLISSTIRVTGEGTNNVNIAQNTFSGGANPTYQCGVSLEIRYGATATGNIDIAGNQFWYGLSNIAPAIAYRDLSGAGGTQPSNTNMTNVRITRNDFRGASAAFVDYWATASGKDGLLFNDSTIPSGKDAATFFGGATPGGYSVAGLSTGNYYPPNLVSSGTSDVPYAAPVVPKTETVGEVTVTGSKVSIYPTYSTKYKRVAYAYKGDTYDVLGFVGKYVRINYGGAGAYLPLGSVMVELTLSQIATASKKGTVYSEAKAQSKLKIGTVAKNDDLIVIGVTNKFIIIDFDGSEGYVQLSGVTF